MVYLLRTMCSQLSSYTNEREGERKFFFFFFFVLDTRQDSPSKKLPTSAPQGIDT